MLATGHIYKITAPNGKAYIGQHETKALAGLKVRDGRVKLKLSVYGLQRRFDTHRKKSSNCVLLKRSIAKYGWDNMTKEVLLRCAPEQLDSYEQAMIAAWDCMAPRGLNCTSGGESNKRLSEDLRRNISAGLARYYETHDNAKKGRPGYELTEEQKKMRKQSTMQYWSSAAGIERREKIKKEKSRGCVHARKNKYYAKTAGSWSEDHKPHHLGVYDTEEDAWAALAEYKEVHVLNSV